MVDPKLVIFDTPEDVDEFFDYDDDDWGEPTSEELDAIEAMEGQYTAWEIIDANQHRLMER